MLWEELDDLEAKLSLYFVTEAGWQVPYVVKVLRCQDSFRIMSEGP